MTHKILSVFFILIMSASASCGKDIYPLEISKKVISLIDYNNNYESNLHFNVSILNDTKLILKKVISKGCSSQIIDTDHIPLLLLLVGSDKYSMEDAQLVYSCIKQNGFNQPRHYVDILGLLSQKKSKLMYQSLYRGYIPQEYKIFGLVEFAKLHCAKEFVTFLEANHYPTNAKKLMTELEYSYFDKYINKMCQK